MRDLTAVSYARVAMLLMAITCGCGRQLAVSDSDLEILLREADFGLSTDSVRDFEAVLTLDRHHGMDFRFWIDADRADAEKVLTELTVPARLDDLPLLQQVRIENKLDVSVYGGQWFSVSPFHGGDLIYEGKKGSKQFLAVVRSTGNQGELDHNQKRKRVQIYLYVHCQATLAPSADFSRVLDGRKIVQSNLFPSSAEAWGFPSIARYR